MAIGFAVKDIMHRIAVKFVSVYLPDAKKPYNLKAVHQPELDIHGVAGKADVYNIETSPKVIEEGLNVGLKLMRYLTADGYRIKTPLFSLRIRIPGEYDGTETCLPDGVRPAVRLQTSAAFREYIEERVQIEFDGIDHAAGFIAGAKDEATGQIDETATIGNILTIRGFGLKIEADEAHCGEAGLFFVREGCAPVRAVVAVNRPRTVKAVVPHSLATAEGENVYTLRLVSQSPVKGHSVLLKEPRVLSSEFSLAIRA